jgi:hypothetical protein
MSAAIRSIAASEEEAGNGGERHSQRRDERRQHGVQHGHERGDGDRAADPLDIGTLDDPCRKEQRQRGSEPPRQQAHRSQAG